MRRRWWELNPRAKKYAEERNAKLLSIPTASLENREIIYFLLKHRDFTCAWYNKSVPIEERLHRALVEAMHRGDEALAFVALEIERQILRNAKRMIPVLRLMRV